ncbi:hypothetical protein FRX31_018165 [Thalictrum thalictroides]|uniref:Polyphenol oxidase C-terminal domain-containing protein n=1 Tax=Thalictrum thalictroides TaxID=46969 RepID=A0A7J6W4F4_THATH|nr:hypothetical protein FRX31_018165 [Thalictrum thalictroides]
MSSKLPSAKTTFSHPYGKTQHNAARRVLLRPCVLGVRPKGLNLSLFCELKDRKEGNGHGILNARKLIRLGLEECFGLAAIIFNKGIIENVSHDTSDEQLDNEHSDQLQHVSEFGSSPRVLDKTVRVLVKRLKRIKEAEILLVDGIENLDDQQEISKFDVYITKPLQDMVGPDYGEFVGSEVDLVYPKNSWKGSLEVCITHLVKAIGAEDSENIVVTLVPKTGQLAIGGVQIVAKRISGNLLIRNLFTYENDKRKNLVSINLKNEFQISKSITNDVSLVLWLMPYFILLFLFRDNLAEVTKMLQ